jgi:hypothetical protein
LDIGTDEREIEQHITRFFHNTLDRNGGRDARRKKPKANTEE